MKITVTLLLFAAALAWAGTDPGAGEYTIDVHVTSSRMAMLGASNTYVQRLDVLIAGKKYELDSVRLSNALLAPGDYKAKILKDDHRTSYDSLRIYEFQFADKKTREFRVVGQTE